MGVSTATIGHDHLDLLISAAIAYDLLTDPHRSSRSNIEPLVAAATATSAGRQLQRVALEAAVVHRGADEPEAYTFTPVPAGDIKPLHVLKAIQAMEHLCQDVPRWTESPSRRLLDAVANAAIQRLPGYVDAPWEWTRCELRRGPALGVAGAWQPEGTDMITWLTPTEARAQWETAQLVVITTNQLKAMDGMPPRPAIYVATSTEISDEVWATLDALSFRPEHVLFLPAALPWLRAQTRENS